MSVYCRSQRVSTMSFTRDQLSAAFTILVFCRCWYYIHASVNEFRFWSSSRGYLVEGKRRGSFFCYRYILNKFYCRVYGVQLLRVSEHQQSLSEKSYLTLVQFSSARIVTEICFENFLLEVFKI